MPSGSPSQLAVIFLITSPTQKKTRPHVAWHAVQEDDNIHARARGLLWVAIRSTQACVGVGSRRALEARHRRLGCLHSRTTAPSFETDRCPPKRSLQRHERTILSGVLNEQLRQLQTFHGSCCLLDTSPFTLPGVPDTLCGDEMQVFGMSLRVDDVVFHGDNAGLLKACVLEDGVLYCIVELWQPMGVVTPYAKRWRSQTGDVRLIDACEMDQAYNIGPISR